MNFYRGLGNPSMFGAAKKKKSSKSSKKGAKGSAFSPGGTPAQLWQRDPAKRKVDLSGLFSPEDTLIAIARGMAPGVLDALDDRATIRGGLTALKMAKVKGYTKVPVETMKSTLANLPEHDDKLIQAAKGGRTLKDAAKHMRKVVHKQGLDKAAWGARQMYVLDNLKGFQLARAVTATVLSLSSAGTLGIGPVVAAGIAVQGAISGAIAKQVATDAAVNLKSGLVAYQAKKKSKASSKKVVSRSGSSSKRTSSSGSSQKTLSTPTSKVTYKRGTGMQRTTEEGSDGSGGSASSDSSSGGSSSGGSSSDAVEASSPSIWWWVGGAAAVVLGGLAWMSHKGGEGQGGSRRATVHRSSPSTPAASPPSNRISLRRKP